MKRKRIVSTRRTGDRPPPSSLSSVYSSCARQSGRHAFIFQSFLLDLLFIYVNRAVSPDISDEPENETFERKEKK